MCGIIGGIASRPIQPILLEGLRRLEYRGYDSAGIATISNNVLERVRVAGKVKDLSEYMTNSQTAQVGIAHTRWATHGVASEENSHPHFSQNSHYGVVHNGIIENYAELKSELLLKGYKFTSETDTEVIVNLLEYTACDTWSGKRGSQLEFDQIVWKTIDKLKGHYALAIIDHKQDETVYATRKGSPLILGIGFNELFVSSDHIALRHVTDRFIFLEEGDRVKLKKDKHYILNEYNEIVKRTVKQISLPEELITKGHYKHFMEKEIAEQPQSLKRCLNFRVRNGKFLNGILGPNNLGILPLVEAVQIVACGSSYHAALVASHWMESFAKIPCRVDIASEYRYRDTTNLPGTLWIAISQSGETADVLSALRGLDRKRILKTLAICNVAMSTLVREADLKLLVDAGPEIGVASTKAFTSQLTILLVLCGLIAKTRSIDFFEEEFVSLLETIPHKTAEILLLEPEIQMLAEKMFHKNNALFLGRGSLTPIAMEGALKLKELSYIFSEAYPAGELKHGPLALVDENILIIVLVPNNHLVEKIQTNIEEILARGGRVVVFVDSKVEASFSIANITKIILNEVNPIIAPILFTIPLQLFAYYVAKFRGTDIDQPRNLAKSVTVE